MFTLSAAARSCASLRPSTPDKHRAAQALTSTPITFKLRKVRRHDARATKAVIDCWFDSGSMPFAQWHYPFENKEQFEQQLSRRTSSAKPSTRPAAGSIPCWPFRRCLFDRAAVIRTASCWAMCRTRTA